jgi:uncharacterized protein involved in exopolysaccharide biosynthesis/Mrp family chromosome partitioning ATPase
MAPQPVGLSLGDIYYVLFRHKWKILICTALGAGAALAVFKLNPAPLRSDAKLFIRYVVSENQISAIGADANAKSPDQRGETIMNSEIEILTSADLARQVAESVGPAKIMAPFGGGDNLNDAATVIRSHLSIDVPPKSSVIRVTFQHPSVDVIQPVLRELIARYLKMHREVHQSPGIVGDFITQQTDQLRSRLAQTEDDLRKARTKAGIISSVEDTKKTYTEQIAALRLQLFEAQAKLAERSAAFSELQKQAGATSGPPAPGLAETPSPAASKAPEPQFSSDVVDQYRTVLAQIEYLSKAETDLLVQFTPRNARVRDIRAQLTDAREVKRKLEQDNPQLLKTTILRGTADASSRQRDIADAAAEIVALQSKIKVLTAELEQVVSDAGKVAEMEIQISELRRKLELEETNYKRFSESLEQSRLDEALGNGRVSNISVIQAPTPPSVDRRGTYKLLAVVGASGLCLGLAWAFAIELYLDRTIRRPVDLERHSTLPLFISIPELEAMGKHHRLFGWHNGSTAKALTTANGSGPAAGPNGSAAALQPFHETLRDRLNGYFESRNLTHKPKLVAVTSVAGKAGVTTTAAGLSRSLSEIGEGNVLLVDMTAGQGSAQQFLKGKAVTDLDELLTARNEAPVEQNLYVVTADSKSDRLSRNMPQRFTKIAPKLKASDFDYIIFDMPPVNQISITPRLAGFMDLVLFVIESERSDRELVNRASQLLAQSGVQVGLVLNKTRNYVPARLHQASLAN